MKLSKYKNIMKTKSFEDKLNKIQRGLKLAYERMIAEKRKNNQQIVVMRDGKIVKINP